MQLADRLLGCFIHFASNEGRVDEAMPDTRNTNPPSRVFNVGILGEAG
jgi:hypothetical protein